MDSVAYWLLLTNTVIGRNWLLRAQTSLANIQQAERASSSSSAASVHASRDHASAEQILNTADYVEARGILLPAIEYFQRAVDAAHAQCNVTGLLLATVC